MRDLLYSLRTRLSLVVLLAFSAMLVLAVQQLVAQREERLKDAEVHLATTAAAVAAQNGDTVAFTKHIVGMVANALAQGKLAQPAACEAALTRLAGQEAHLSHLAVARPNGDIVCSGMPMPGAINVADRPYFRRALASEGTGLGRAVVSRLSGEFVLPFFRAVRGADGRVTGVVIAALDLAWLNRTFGRGHYPPGSRVGLVAPSGLVIARYPDRPKWVGRNVSRTAFFRTVVAGRGERVAETLGVDGVRRVYAFARFADTVEGPIYLWVGVPKNQVTASADRSFAASLGVLLLVMVLTFGAIMIGGERLFMRPIVALRDAARRLSQGDLAARSGLRHARHELGQLAQSFDEMAGALYSMRQVVRAGRALRVLSESGRLTLAADDEKSLLESSCQAIVESGGYRSACVLYRGTDGEAALQPVAGWSVATPGLDVGDSLAQLGPAQAALRDGKPVTARELNAGPESSPIRSMAKRHGFSSALFLPLNVGERAAGILAVCAEEPDAFDAEEVLLLGEAAERLALGIGTQRVRAERARLEASLKGSEELFRAAADASLDALYILKSLRDPGGAVVDFEIVTLNARGAALARASAAQLVGKRVSQVMPFADGRAIIAKLAEVVETRAPLEDESLVGRGVEGTRWLRFQVVALGDGVAVSARDVTQWKLAGDRLRESEERLRLATEFARQGAWSWDFARNAFSASDEVGPILGLPRGAGFANPEAFLTGVHPADRDEVAEVLRRFREEGAPYRLDFRVRWPDGSVHWVDGQGSVLHDAAGKPVRALGIVMDITERKTGELALERALRALRTLSSVNGRLVRANSEQQLLEDVCQVIVNDGGYCMAGVAYAQQDARKTLVPMAVAGDGAREVAAGAPTWGDSEDGQRPISRAIRSGEPQLSRDIAADPAFGPLREAASEAHWAANLALPLTDGDRSFGALSIYASDPEAFDAGELSLLRELADDLTFGILGLRTRLDRNRKTEALREHERMLTASLQGTIAVVAAMVDMRDPYTSGHQQRVADLAVAIGGELGLSAERLEGLKFAGVVHDLGKIQVPAEILARPGRLTKVEFELLKGHPQAGYAILKDIKFPWPIADIVRQHHERLDGSGYPQGLQGDQILLEARIMAVADVVEAMSSHRPYRPALGIEAALAEIERGKGSRFDAAAVEACARLIRSGRFALAGPDAALRRHAALGNAAGG